MTISYFLRGAPYDYNVAGLNLYQSFDALAKGYADPPILEEKESYRSKLEKKVGFQRHALICAPDKRSFQTAQLICPMPKKREALSEIRYSMYNFISETEFFGTVTKPDVKKARERFVDALVADRLDEPYDKIMARVKRTLAEAKGEGHESVIAISHGFFMKVLECYVRDNLIDVHPERLRIQFEGKSIAYDFLCGFRITFDQEIPRFAGYM